MRGHEAFLLKRAGRDAAEKITDINRRFEKVAVIGLPGFVETFLQNLPDNKMPAEIIRFDDWPDSLPSGQNLIISGLTLQSLNHVPAAVMSACAALESDGLFLASFLGGESLLDLRRACFGADQEKFGGITSRVAPMIDIQQAAALMGAAGLAQPVIDRDRCEVGYKKLQTLVSDLRDIGETNALIDQDFKFPGRDFLKRLTAHYQGAEDEKKYQCIFEIIWMTGWSPHDSQQKPLKPGEGKTRLVDALKKIKNEKL